MKAHENRTEFVVLEARSHCVARNRQKKQPDGNHPGLRIDHPSLKPRASK